MPHPFTEAPFLRSLGVEVVEAMEGRARLAMTVTGQHTQVHGLTHGGVISTLLDSAAACACFATLPAGCVFTSTEFTVQFLRPVPAGRCEAQAVIVHRGRRRLVVDATLTDEGGKVCARYTGGFLIVDPA